MTIQVVRPCWAEGIARPSLVGPDPARQARDLVSESAASVARAGGKGSLVTPDLVDQVFGLVQLALDDRSPPPAASVPGQPVDHSPEAEKAFRSALAPGALALVPKLAAAFQVRQGNGYRRDIDQGLEHPTQEKEPMGGRGEGGGGGGGGGGGEESLRSALVLAAKHVVAMEELVSRQNNTPALLIAHNGLAKLLKNNWPWLLGGVVNAPRLLSRLCEIYRDGLSQLNITLARAGANEAASVSTASKGGGGHAPGGEGGAGAREIAHLKKFGKLLATFGVRMACLLRYLGPECPREETWQAYRLYAKAAARAYPGLLASLRGPDGIDGDAAAAAATGVHFSEGVAGEIIYPRAVEAFLSTAERSPCCQSSNGVGDVASSAAPASGARGNNGVGSYGGTSASGDSTATIAATVAAPAGQARRGGGGIEPNMDLPLPKPSGSACCCYEGTTRASFSGRGHDPWEALEALRPTDRPPPPLPRTDTSDGRNSGGVQGAGGGGGGGDDSGGSDGGGQGPQLSSTKVDPLGAVLLLCEVLCREGRAPTLAVPVPRLRECCGWVLDHLASLFPGWVEFASAASAANADAHAHAPAGGSVASDAWASELGVAAALCDKVATALGLFVSRRALGGEFQEAQVQLIEGCAGHPNPVCREVWIGALKVFLLRCDAAAQETCIQSLANAALDRRVSRRCRRRLGHALAAVCAATTTTTTTASNSTTATIADGPTALLLPRARASLFRSCMLRLGDGRIEGGGSDGDGGSSSSSSSRSGSGREHSGACGDATCALDLLCVLPAWRVPSSRAGASGRGSGLGGVGGVGGDTDGEELAAAAVSFARTLVTSSLRKNASAPGGGLGGAGGAVGGGRGEDSSGGAITSGGGNRIEQGSLAAAARFLAAWSRPVAELHPDGIESGIGRHTFLAGVDETAREVGRGLGDMLVGATADTWAGLSEQTLSAIARLLAKTNPGGLPRMCALIVEEAGEGRVAGEALLALAEALSWAGHPYERGNQGDATRVWQVALEDGFALLFRSRLWPVITAAMQALEAVARCVDPGITALLPRLLPSNLLAVFRGRVAKRIVYSDGGRPLEPRIIRERGLAEARVLIAAAAGAALRREESTNGWSRQVVLREGGNLSELAGLLTSTVVGFRLLSAEEGGGVCLTLKAQREEGGAP